MGMRAKYRQGQSTGQAWNDLYNLRHSGRNAVILGTWSGPEGHWITAYEHHPKEIWAMNPWHGFYDGIHQDRFNAQFWGDYVDVWY
jgi:hypothetical protein